MNLRGIRWDEKIVDRYSGKFILKVMVESNL